VITSGGIYAPSTYRWRFVILKISSEPQVKFASRVRRLPRWRHRKCKISPPFAQLRVLPSDHEPQSEVEALFIFAVILFCIYFLFRLPVFPTSVAQVKDNFSRQIKLPRPPGRHAPDLQVQVQEAIAQETDTTVTASPPCCARKIFTTMKCAVWTTRTFLSQPRSAQLSQFRDIFPLNSTTFGHGARCRYPSGYTLTLRPALSLPSRNRP